MITNAILYRLSDPAQLSVATFDECFDTRKFLPCGPTQEKSCGFVPPRGEAHGALAECVDGQLIMKLMTETKSVPAAVIRRVVDEKIEQIFQSTGRKPGKKETRDLRDDVRLALLPDAWPKQVATLIWIDPDANLLVIDAASQVKADDVVSFLVAAIPGLAVQLLCTKLSPTGSMAEWLLSGEAPAGFTVDRDCELKASDESKAVVRYARCALDTEEVRNHIQRGKMPTQLALTWNSHVSFVMNDGLQLKKIVFLESALNGDKGMTLDNDAFDANVVIVTGELRQLIPDLVDALGGEITS